MASTSEPGPRPSESGDRHRLPVVVGVEDAPDNALAVAWAAEEAVSRGVPLTVVRAYTWAMATPYTSANDRYIVAGLRADAEKTAQRALEQARTHAPGLEVDADIVEKYAPDLLTERSRDASLVVLGCTHRTALSRAVMGSVSSVVAAQSHAPVVVVCGPPPLAGQGSTVVVGIKPDETAQPVLSFAFEHAARHGLALRVVLCWRAAGFFDSRPLAERATRWSAEALAGWREAYPDVPVTTVLRQDEAAPTLIEESMNSSLLVVGRHGRTPRLGAVLGSVSQSVIHHGARPVAIVPVEQPAEP